MIDFSFRAQYKGRSIKAEKRLKTETRRGHHEQLFTFIFEI